MTDDLLELAHECVQRPEWEWRAGCGCVAIKRTHTGAPPGSRGRILRHERRRVVVIGWNSGFAAPTQYHTILPDLTDDATGGVILGMLIAYRGGNHFSGLDRAIDNLEDALPHMSARPTAPSTKDRIISCILAISIRMADQTSAQLQTRQIGARDGFRRLARRSRTILHNGSLHTRNNSRPASPGREN